ncbi:hypothetical protein GQ457_16G002770 [Hibiscus cannabinus]
MGSMESGVGSSSSRKGKKGSSEKPKQPQRGLGVAQLEKIRLHGQMVSGYNLPIHHGSYPANFNQVIGSSSSFSYPSSTPAAAACGFLYPNTAGLGEYDQRANFRYGDSQPSTTASSGNLEISQHFAQPNMTRQLLNLHVEDSHSRSKKHRSNSLGSSSQNSESSDTQEVDLELRLSL